MFSQVYLSLSLKKTVIFKCFHYFFYLPLTISTWVGLGHQIAVGVFWSPFASLTVSCICWLLLIERQMYFYPFLMMTESAVYLGDSSKVLKGLSPVKYRNEVLKMPHCCPPTLSSVFSVKGECQMLQWKIQNSLKRFQQRSFFLIPSITVV